MRRCSATRAACSAASRRSAANARTVSMFARLSATCPETRAIASSRWSTSRWRRRISGTTPIGGDREQPEQRGDEPGAVAPQDHAREPDRHEVADDVEHERVGELLEAGGEAQHPLGQRPGEVVVVERGVLREQLVHADHVQVLDGVAVEAVHAVQADPPQHLGKQQQAREAEDVRHGLARGDGAMGREPADQRGDDQRRDIGDAGGAERGQQHPRQGEAPEQRHLPAVVAQHEQHRPLPVRCAAAMVRSRHLFPIRATSLAMVHDGRPSQRTIFRPAVTPGRGRSGREPVAGDAFGQVLEEGTGLLAAASEVGLDVGERVGLRDARRS